jgi:hypothetical protein
MRYDAADARELGCTGLIGIHWRTKALATNIAALAAAGWDQSWIPPSRKSATIAAPPHRVPFDSDTTVPGQDRSMPVEEFYVDFARTNFGPEVAEAAGKLLAKIDGHRLPEPSGWIDGPGALKVNPGPWARVRMRYAFVDELAGLRGRVRGPASLGRFDDLLDTYRAMATMAELGCTRGELDRQAARIKAEKDPTRRKALAGEAVATRVRLARLWRQLIGLQLAATGTPGEIGTLANLEQHTRNRNAVLTVHDSLIIAALGDPLPLDAELSRSYTGSARLIVPTVRTQAAPGERMAMKVIALASQPMTDLVLLWRPLGRGEFRSLADTPLGRAVHIFTMPPAEADFEYYLEARTADGQNMAWPPGAPRLNQTVVVARLDRR